MAQVSNKEVINDVIRDTVFDAIVKKISALWVCQTLMTMKLEKTTFWIVSNGWSIPEVEVQGLSDIEVGASSCQRGRRWCWHHDWKPTKTTPNLRCQRGIPAATEGDQVCSWRRFNRRCEKEEFEGGSAKTFSLVLGSGRMIPGFEDGIRGTKAGREKPSTWRSQKIASRKPTR